MQLLAQQLQRPLQHSIPKGHAEGCQQLVDCGNVGTACARCKQVGMAWCAQPAQTPVWPVIADACCLVCGAVLLMCRDSSSSSCNDQGGTSWTYSMT